MSSTTAALALCRFCQDTAALGLWGAWATLAWLVPRHIGAAIDHGARRCTAVMVAVAALATAAELPILAASIGDGWRDALDPALTGSILVDTAPGHAWAAQAGAAVLLFAARWTPQRMRPGATAAAAALLLAGLALTGHAAMREGALGLLQRTNDVLHVLAAGAWFGALVPVLAILHLPDWPERREGVVTALRRFSRAGHAAVALVLLSGLVNAGLVLGRWPHDLASPYEALLDAKVLAVAGSVTLALVNRYVLVPRLCRHPEATLVALRGATLAELPLGIAAVALVAVFGLLDPN